MKEFKTVKEAIRFAITSSVNYDIVKLEKQLKENGIARMNGFIFVVDEHGILEEKKPQEKHIPSCYTCGGSGQVEGRRIGYDSIMEKCPDCGK